MKNGTTSQLIKRTCSWVAAVLLLSQAAHAQLHVLNSVYTDTTKYRAPLPADTTRYTPLSVRNDSIYVVREQHAAMQAIQATGHAARFVWQRLDTATLTFSTLWTDIVELDSVITPYPPITIDSSDCGNRLPIKITYTNRRNASTLPDSVPAGYYRVLTDTLQTVDSIVICDHYVDKDTIDIGYAYAKTPVGVRFAPADTFSAWVFVDTFRIDSVQLVSRDCEFTNLQVHFYPQGINEGYYIYRYLDLRRTPLKELRELPDCGDCYIHKVSWEPSVDIYKDADGDFDQSWKTSYNAYIPSPFYDATYKVTVTNYFGITDTFTTDTIEAHATFAKMKVYVEKTDESGRKAWSEKTSETEKENSPVNVELANASINAYEGATFTWKFFGNTYELPEEDANKPAKWLPLWQDVTTIDTGERVRVPEPYKPGRYPMLLQVLNRHGCTSADTFVLEVEEYLIDPKAVPTAFSPNGDEFNNTYKLRDPDQNVHSVESFEINIVNRYGQLVFSSRNLRFEWDGKLRGTNAKAVDGAYFYIIKASGYNKQRKPVKQTLKGYLHLFGSRN